MMKLEQLQTHAVVRGIIPGALLMSATPHNGKEADFQLFMALLDGDRFEGKFRDGVRSADVSDLMRRMVKENLRKFDGTPLFPERIAYTVPYNLSPPEEALFKAVTEYVRNEFNRAEALENDKRAGHAGQTAPSLPSVAALSAEEVDDLEDEPENEVEAAGRIPTTCSPGRNANGSPAIWKRPRKATRLPRSSPSIWPKSKAASWR